MRETLTNLVESYGYFAVFVLIALESLVISLPGESALVSAARICSFRRLSLPWALAGFAGVAAAPTASASQPQAWEFLVRRFEPGEYLGLHLTIGLAISIGFGGVTEDVIHHDPQFDLLSKS